MRMPSTGPVDDTIRMSDPQPEPFAPALSPGMVPPLTGGKSPPPVGGDPNYVPPPGRNTDRTPPEVGPTPPPPALNPPGLSPPPPAGSPPGSPPMLPGLPSLPPRAPSADDGTNQAALQTGVTRQVDAPKETVQGQLQGMLTAGSPVLEAARAKAERAAAARGLQNSSMAAEAGTSALLQQATQIATADANVYGTASRDNQAALNNASTANQAALNQFAGQRLQAKLQIDQTQLQSQADLTKLITQGNIEGALAQLKNTMEIERQAMENQGLALRQGSASVSTLMAQTQASIAAILQNKDLDAPAKDRAVQLQLNMLRASAGLIGGLAGDVNLLKMLDDILGMPSSQNPGGSNGPNPPSPPPPGNPPAYPPPDVPPPPPNGGGHGGGH